MVTRQHSSKSNAALAIAPVAPNENAHLDKRHGNAIELDSVRLDHIARRSPEVDERNGPVRPAIGPLMVTATRDCTPPRSEASTARAWATLALSIIGHVAFLVAALWSPSRSGLGVGGSQHDGVSVEIVSMAALESAMRPQPMVASPTMRETPVDPLVPSSIDMPAVAPQVAAQSPPKDHTPPAASDDAVAPAPEVATPPADEKRPDKERQEAPENTTPRDQVDAAPQPALTSAKPTSQPFHTDQLTPASGGASPGVLSRYAIEIRLAIGKVRPRHGGQSGRVSVSFGLDESGTVRFVAIANSSGSQELDQAAQNAVLRATFPAPPAMMTDAQRTFTVPFDFK
ncbi:MAG: hypothetical protein RL291_951 [Pseudomonadota bacterium]|jgi:protein TonB